MSIELEAYLLLFQASMGSEWKNTNNFLLKVHESLIKERKKDMYVLLVFSLLINRQ